jgi:hypothetical protein
MERAQKVLDIFCKASGAKINWNKSSVIWASKEDREWEWGREVGLQWIPKGKGVKYLGIQVGFHLSPESNFDKMLSSLKGKLINWSTYRLSLAGRILVANQVLLASMWYLAATWSPNPRMCSQVCGIVRNFIWSGKVANARAKVKWETLVLPISQGGLGIIDPKTQSEALLAKLLVRGLAPGGEPWKELLRHKANQTKLPVHGMGPTTQDINWLFAATKLKRPPISLWKSILHSWLSVKPDLRKSEPTNSAETLRQPVFGNPFIVNQGGRPLGLSGKSEGNAFASAGHSKIGNFWDSEKEDWKSLPALEMGSHPTNSSNRDLIISSIPWDPATARKNPEVGEWVGKREPDRTAPPTWVYQITETNHVTANAKEYKRTSSAGRIQATSPHDVTISLEGYRPVKVLTQEGYGATLKIAKDIPPPGKKPPIYWIFETGFIPKLEWDPGDWHWQQTGNIGDAPFFSYSANRGYRNAKKKHHIPSIITFVQSLSLRNSTVTQVIAKVWHNARPRKVGALTWLILNKGLPVGTWLQVMGIPAACKGCDQGPPESAQHCLMDCTPAQQAWKAFHRVWNEWRAPNRLHITWPFLLLGEAVFEEDDDPPDLHSYHTGGFTYYRQPLDILKSFLVYYLWSERCRRHFNGQYSLKRVLLQAWEATTEVGMATWRAIRSPSQSRKHELQISIEQAFRAEWLHGHIFGEGETAISWRLFPPLYFLDFFND